MVRPSSSQLHDILSQARTIAMVGASSNPARPSWSIMKMLQEAGYRVIPVNPNETSVLGEKAYAFLADIPEKIDIVNVFRRPETTLPLANEAAQAGAGVLWLQLGVINEETAARARELGLTVIMDQCIAIVHRALNIKPVQ